MPQLNRGYDTSFCIYAHSSRKESFLRLSGWFMHIFFAGELRIPITIVQ
jgi:hypothetical protein